MIEPYRIDPEATFDDGSLSQCLGLSSSALGRARREGLLRYCTVGNRCLYKGRWILAWMDAVSQPALPCPAPAADGRRV
jgi:hypothetical protein